MKKPSVLISAIVSTYNSELFIRGKIEDLLEQTIADRLEIIVVNSGSLQNEDKIINEFLLKHNNIKYIKTEQRETIYKAWNKAIRAASGQFITNANTDDRLRNDAYEILSNELLNNPDAALVYADQYITYIPNEKFDITKANQIVKMPDFNPLVQLERCIVFSQPMWRASLHLKDNFWFDETLEICGDHEFELNISTVYKMKHIDLVLGTFYKSNIRSNISFRNIELVDRERKLINHKYIRKYIDNLDDKLLIELWNKFKIYILMPYIISRILLKIKSLFIKKNHVFSQEFIYLFSATLLERLNKKDRAIKICKKFLNFRFSKNINDQLNHLVSLSK